MLASSAVKKDSTALLVVAAACLTAGGFLLGRQWKKKEKNEKGLTITLPDWAVSEYDEYASRTFETDEDCMRLAIELSARNTKERTGGPFGTAIFEVKEGKRELYAIGVNRVVPCNNSTLHGEMVAIQFAQAKRQSFTLQGDGSSSFELFTSASPCCQCLGGCLWSGICKVVAGASKDDVEAIGFDEGPVYSQSYDHLRKNGIEVKLQVLQEEARKVLMSYGESGVIYNG